MMNTKVCPAVALMMLLLVLSLPGRAQFAALQIPPGVFIAVPFMVEVTLDCPPPGEAPPPRNCNGGTVAFFDVSDSTAVVPQPVDGVVLIPNLTIVYGPFTFHRPGRQDIVVTTIDDFGEAEWLGQVSFVVQPPGLARKPGLPPKGR